MSFQADASSQQHSFSSNSSLLIRNHLAISCLSSGCQLIVALPLLSSPDEPSSSCAANISLYAESPGKEKDSDDKGKDDSQPDPAMMILLLFDARSHHQFPID
jgi:hypothetical protein